MAWKDMNTSGAIDIKKVIGESHEGTYVSKKDIVTKIGPQVVWEFTSDTGNFGIYGFTNLNRIMEQVPEGTAVKITYRGTKNIKTKFGMKDVHQVDVQRWEEDEREPGSDDDVLEKF